MIKVSIIFFDYMEDGKKIINVFGPDIGAIYNNMNVCHPFIYLKTRDSCHSISKANLYQYSPLFARKIQENKDLAEIYIDIHDPKDKLKDFIKLLSNSRFGTYPSDLKAPDYDFIIKICNELQMYDYIADLYRIINENKLRNQPSWRYKREELQLIDKIIQRQHLFLDLTHDNLEITKSIILNEGYLEKESSIEIICYSMLAASISRFNHKLLAEILLFIIAKTPNFNTKDIFLQITLSYAYSAKYYMLIIVFYLLDYGIYSSKEIFDEIYPRCIQYPAISLLFIPEIYEIDPIIAQNIDIYSNNMMFDNHRVKLGKKIRNKVVNEIPDDNFASFKELRLYGCLKNSIQYSIMNDDINPLKEFVKEEGFDFHQIIECSPMNMHRKSLENCDVLAYAAFYGSTQCFKFILKHIEIKRFNFEKLSNLSTAGGDSEIIKLLEELKVSFANCAEYSIKFHRPVILKWIFTNNSSVFKIHSNKYNAARKGNIITNCFNNANLEAYVMLTKHIHYKHVQSFDIRTNLTPCEFIEAYKFIYTDECIRLIGKFAFEFDSIAHMHLIVEQKLITHRTLIQSMKDGIKYRSKHVIKYLLQKQSDPDGLNHDRLTYYQYAMCMGYDDIASLFPHNKCDPSDYIKFRTNEDNVKPIFYFANEMEPDFEISTRKGKWMVHSYILFSVSLVAQKLYHDDPSIRKLHIDVDYDLSPILDYFKGETCSFRCRDIELFKTLEIYHIFVDNTKKNQLLNCSFDITNVTIALQKCFIDVTQENIEIMKNNILSNPHTIAENYQALVDSLIISVMSRPGNRFLCMNLATFVFKISPTVVSSYLITVFNKCYNLFSILSFTCHLLSENIIDRDIFMIELKKTIAKHHHIKYIILYFAPEIEEFSSETIQVALPGICQSSTYNINLKQLKENNWKILRELRVHGEKIGSALYCIKYDMDKELKMIDSIRIIQKTSVFNPYSEVNNKKIFILEYAMFYSAKKCYNFLIKFFKTKRYRSRHFNAFAVISGLVPITIAEAELQSDEEDLSDDQKTKSYLIIAKKALIFHRTDYFVSIFQKIISISENNPSSYLFEMSKYVNLECFREYFEAFSKTTIGEENESVMQDILFFAGRKDFLYNFYSRAIYYSLNNENVLRASDNDVRILSRVEMRIRNRTHKKNFNVHVSLDDLRDEQVLKQQFFNINETCNNKTLLDNATFLDNKVLIEHLEAKKALRNRLMIEGDLNQD